MAINVFEHVNRLEEEREQLLELHLSAIQVLDNKDAGPASFQINKLNNDQLDALPDYIGQFVGSEMPRIERSEDGGIRNIGTIAVTENDTKFTSKIEEDNEGNIVNVINWDKEVWDEDTAAIIEKKNKRQIRWRRIGAATLFGCFSTSIAYLVMGTFNYRSATNENINYKENQKEVIDVVENDSLFDTSEGMNKILIGMAGITACYAATIPILIKEEKRLREANIRKNKVRYAFPKK